MIPSVWLAVDGSARTFNCVVVVPSTDGGVVPSTMTMAGVVGRGVLVGAEIRVDGKVAVTNPGVAVYAFSLLIFNPQLEIGLVLQGKGKYIYGSQVYCN